ncbi:MAG TPA: hypothetical protein VIM98_08660 [Dyella sp.]|uniref:hypothetical protein n=1 Tax=Dyella sp. TaxID=1869338 RepID=UPI002F928835
MTLESFLPRNGWRALALALALTLLVYWPGLYGSWLFDDYPNIVDNHGVQPDHASLGTLVGAALSSPASDLKRPLASLSFAANFLASGLDPFPMKLCNLLLHLLNGALVFLLARSLLRVLHATPDKGSDTVGWLAAALAAGWLLLPINLTAVLYVVQRMESMANLFVLLGLFGYVTVRHNMLVQSRPWLGLAACFGSLIAATAFGLLAKETAVLLPLYALAIEWIVFGFRARDGALDKGVIALFLFVLVVPMIAGLSWLLPGLLRPEAWATRDFTLGTRLLTEARIVLGYISWTLLPLASSLSFYHDDYVVSSDLVTPWTTLPSLVGILILIALPFALRRRRPLVALGLSLFIGCHLLTGTVLPLELVYEHRNYFASFGLLLALAGTLLPPSTTTATPSWRRKLVPAVFAVLMLWWTGLTAVSAYDWGDALRLSQTLAERGPESPRAQYELGRTYIIYSHYEPGSPYTQLAYAPLERAALLPKSSILPQQALIFMNSRMELPLKDTWWDSMTAKLAANQPGVQDESSLAALTQCARDRDCDLPEARMKAAFEAALSHPHPSARLMSTYGDYAWNVLGDRKLGERMTEAAANAAPNEAAYRITLVRMLVAEGRLPEAQKILQDLDRLNIAGRLDGTLSQLRLLTAQSQTRP